jgi:hypothetical protein
MLGGFGLGCGVLWVGSGAVMVVGVVQEEERQRGEVRVVLLLVFLVSRPGSGQERLGLDRGMSKSMATGPGVNGNSVGHSRIDFNEICPPGARRNVRKKFEFEFFENGHCGLSRYWTRVPEVFLLQREMKFCRFVISNLKFGHCFRFQLCLMFAWGSGLSFCLKNLG